MPKKLYKFRLKRGSRVLGNRLLRPGDEFESFVAEHTLPQYCNQLDKIDEKTVRNDYVIDANGQGVVMDPALEKTEKVIDPDDPIERELGGTESEEETTEGDNDERQDLDDDLHDEDLDDEESDETESPKPPKKPPAGTKKESKSKSPKKLISLKK